MTNYFIVIIVSFWSVVSATSCRQVNPSEYAYRSNSVQKTERNSANCRMYEEIGLKDKPGVVTKDYTHCNGTELRLIDSELGSDQYTAGDYYVWHAQITGSGGRQLLFILPTRVNLTTTTLHYYSDNARALPRLRFWSVQDNFEIWDAPTASYSHVEVTAMPPGGAPAGRRNVSFDFNFNTLSRKVLLYIYTNSYAFAVSEVEFWSCNDSMTYTSNETMLQTTTSLPTKGSTKGNTELKTFTTEVAATVNNTVSESNAAGDAATITTSTEIKEASTTVTVTTIGIVIAILILLFLTIAIATILLLIFLRKSTQNKIDYDSSYSTLCRESVQQTQSQSLHTSSDLYDQIQLSPSTGQAEFISRNETANTIYPPPHQTGSGIHPSVDKDKPKSAKLKITASTISSQDEDKSTSEQPTYAVINKKKQKTKKESVNCKSQNTAAVSQNEGVTEQNAVEQGNYDQESQDSPDTTTQFPSQTIDSLQELYTAVKKKPKDRPVEDEIAPPIPPYTTEELYTAVKKKPKASAAGDEQAPQIPPHTIEELYTAVQKKPKACATDDEDEAPPIPAHTVEELYTAVVKKPKVSRAEDEEEAPPVPPYTVDEL